MEPVMSVAEALNLIMQAAEQYVSADVDEGNPQQVAYVAKQEQAFTMIDVIRHNLEGEIAIVERPEPNEYHCANGGHVLTCDICNDTTGVDALSNDDDAHGTELSPVEQYIQHEREQTLGTQDIQDALTPRSRTIDLTPMGMKTPEGNKRVNEALADVESATTNVANLAILLVQARPSMDADNITVYRELEAAIKTRSNTIEALLKAVAGLK